MPEKMTPTPEIPVQQNLADQINNAINSSNLGSTNPSYGDLLSLISSLTGLPGTAIHLSASKNGDYKNRLQSGAHVTEHCKLCVLFLGRKLGKRALEGVKTYVDNDGLGHFTTIVLMWPGDTNYWQVSEILTEASGKAVVAKIKGVYPSSNVIEVVNAGSRRTTLDIGRPLQLITYGAPGTGKSFGTDSELGDSEAKVFRTTFHPDSDYSTFVGTYKPTMKSVDRIVQIGQDLKMPNFASGVPKELKTEEKITYKFRPQAFMNAYAKAWRELSGKEDKPPKPVVLIIEEINRGNCAQIFGDLFQLLDRDDKSGYSTYPITADIDLAKWLAEAEQFGPTGLDGIVKPYCIKQEDWVQILKGEMLALPPNLYIWATMNTSDQSLFPIDSAFKRRWDWKYVPIREGKLKNGQPMNWKIKIKKDYTYDWWKFLKCVNARIFKTTESEDKKLGYFFVKPDGKSKPELDYNDCISADRFVSKVIFYLWNDVFKDYGIETIFKVADADKKPEDAAKGVEFQAFFNEEDDHANVDTLHAFFEQLGLKPDEEKKAADNPQVQEGDVKPEV